MRSLVRTFFASLALLPMVGFACDQEEPSQHPAATHAPILGHTVAPVGLCDLENPHATIRTWHTYFMQITRAPLTPHMLDQGYALFSKHQQLAHWISYLFKDLQRPSPAASAQYLDHLIQIAPSLAPGGQALDSQTLLHLFPNTPSLLQSANCFLAILNNRARTQPAHVALSRDNTIINKNLFNGFDTLFNAYCERAISKDGTLPEKDALGIAQLVLNIYNSPLYNGFCDAAHWYAQKLTFIRNKAPNLPGQANNTLTGLIRLTQTDPYGHDMTEHFASESVALITPLLANDAFCRLHGYWMYPLLAKSYFALDMGEECVDTWAAYEASRAPHDPWCQRDLLSAVVHMSYCSNESKEIDHWWKKYQDQTQIRLAPFAPTENDLRAIEHVTSVLLELNPLSAYPLLSKTLAYLDGDGASLCQGPHANIFMTSRKVTSLKLANVLTRMGRYEEAATLYEQYIKWDHEKLIFCTGQHLSKEQAQQMRETIQPEFESAMVAYLQTGRIKRAFAHDNQSHKRGGTKKTARGRGNHAKKNPPFVNDVHKQIKSYYQKRMLALIKQLDVMMSTSRKFDDAPDLYEHLQALRQEAGALKGAIDRFNEATTKKGAHKHSGTSSHASTSTAQTDPSLITYGRSVDELFRTLESIKTPFETAHASHKLRQRKALEAYFTQLRQAGDDAALFVPTSTPGPSTPVARAPKKKTRGAPVASSSTQAPSPTLTKSAEDAPQLFMKKQAQSDYEKLDAHLLEKFHALAHEITLNPYQIIGGQGRPERLVTHAGVYLSRKLTDGDRVVYELTKDAEDKVRVIFVSLLGHYKHLARQKK